MYRKPGSPGVLKGVLSGPYAGGRRLVDAAKLPRAARQRLADVLTGRADPTPILHEHPGGLASRFRATWGVLVAILALSSLIAMGFADPRAAWAYQPRSLVLGYAAAGTLLALSLLSLYRRRALASGGAIVPGRYLLPLDVVEVPPEDAAGDQVLVVTPLGSGRDARIRTTERREELVIVFDGGAEIAFPLRNEREGEHALRRLEHAQTVLEALTYGRELEKALANDAFFDVRVDDSWGSLVPAGPASGAVRKRRRLIHGSFATAAALLAGSALGWAAFVGRSWASDRALFLRALRIGTTESLDSYLVRGTSHRDDAIGLRDRLEEQRAALAAAAKQSHERSRPGFEPPSRSEWELTPEEAAQRRGSAESCVAGVRARANPAHPEVAPIMEKLIARARRTGDPILPVRIDAHLGARPSDAPDSDHAARAARSIWAFERIFSETCPASLVRFAARPVERANIGAPGLSPGIDLKIDVSWPSAPTWKKPGLVVYAPTISFEVTLHGEAIDDLASFHLTMPPPALAPTQVRPRSLFIVETADDHADAGTLDANVVPLLTARAFDRLYDELYGLFFAGDPRVPLRADEGE
ncbi:MAG: hypothetical protein QOI41_3767 [Myxococcales bacterium]|nr:hypothetical protein [Myxococcales bacterium]